MADLKQFVNVNHQGLKIKDAVVNVYATKATAETEFTTLGFGINQKGMQVIMADTLQEWTWNGTAFVQPSVSEMMIEVASAPINTDVNGVVVTGVAPTLSASIKLITWKDANGRIHLYQVGGTLALPVITEITEKSRVKLATTETTITGLQGLSNFRRNSVYVNTTTGQIFDALEDGEVIEVADGIYDVFVEFKPKTFLPNSSNTFDINVFADIQERTPDTVDADVLEAKTANMLSSDVEVLDANNNFQKVTSGVDITPIDKQKFKIDVVAGGNFVVVANFPAKKL